MYSSAAHPPTRNVHCQAINALVPVPVLVWAEYQQDHFRAEPLPGYVYHVMKDAEGLGWLFQIPGKPITPCTKRHLATNACEYYWFRAIKVMMNPGLNHKESAQ